MISEALQFLIGQGLKAADPKPVYESTALKRVVIDGKLVDVPKALPDRKHDVEALDEIVALAKRFAGAENSSPVVWYSSSGVQLVIHDDEYRADTATVEFSETAVWETVRQLEKKAWLDQAAFVRLLRIDLASALDSAVLLDRVKRLKWQAGSTTDRVVGFGKESLGRDIKAEVNAESEIPEFVDLAVRVHSNPGEDERWVIHCAVEINAPEAKLRLVPLPDEIARVSNLVVASIAERLRAGLPESVPCYHGSN